MKKFIAILTAFVLLMGVVQLPSGVFAEEKAAVNLKQAIEIAKTTLNLKTEGFEFNSSYVENQNGFNLWSLSWNNNKLNESINVSVDAGNGEIISVGWYTPYEQPKSRIPKHTKSEAIKAAEAWAIILQPAKFIMTKLNDNPNQDYYNKFSDVYSFEYVRMQDGVQVTPNTINIQLDKNTLKLRSFNITWDKQNLPSKASAFNADKAKEFFKSKLGLELTYNFVYNNGSNEPKVVLAYTLKNGNSPIDAISGEILNNMYRIYYGMDKVMNEKASASPVVITPEEQTELEKNSKYISKDEAIQASKQYIKLDENMKLERANLYPGYNKTNAAWYLEWKYTNPEDKSVRFASIQIDAVNKELKYFNINMNNDKIDKNQKPMDKAQAQKLAEEFLNKVQPEKFKKTQYRETKDLAYGIMPPYQNGYMFNFIRVENGVPCPSNSLTVSVNQYTGDILNFNANWMDVSFPAPSKVIGLDKAYETLFNKLKFDMQYIYHYPNNNDYENKELKLAYILENANVLIDANNGQMLNYDGTPLKSDAKLVYTDIKGNKAEDAINTLIEMGILVPESTKFAPETKMLQKDFIKLLMNAIQPEYYPMPLARTASQYDNYYNEAIRRKLITAAEKKPDAMVTRQDAAKMIVRAMNYGVIAEKSNMFAVNFKDASKITKNYKGYAVMAAEFGIIVPEKGYFNPNNTLTRGDAAQIIVNYLKCETSL